MLNTNTSWQKQVSRNWLAIILWGAFSAVILFLLIYRLNDWPNVWWDEGWTLSAVRNWILHGHLGNYLDGQPVPPGIPMRFPVAILVALSMKVFGIGVWQGRLPGVLVTALMLSLYVYISSKMYGRRVGMAALLMVICLSPFTFQPIISGRQVMAEMPMMFYLLAGYSLVWLALTRSPYWSIGATVLFGLAIHAKLQVPPFWLVSIGLAILTAVIQRNQRATRVLASVAAGSILAAIVVYLIQDSVMPGSFSDPALLRLLLNTSVISLAWSIRWRAIYITVLFALPEVLAYIWASRPILRSIRSRLSPAEEEDLQTSNSQILRSAIWGLGASWLIWYVIFSSYWVRYIFPPYFLGLIFVSAFVGEHTHGYDLKLVIKRTSALLFKRDFSRTNFQALGFILALAIALGIAIGTYPAQMTPTKWQPFAAAKYLQEHIPAGAKVETYESELFFLDPQINFHFPPDLVSMQLYRRADIDHNYPITYDPLAAHPDYLVVGPYAQTYGVYSDPLIQQWFELDETIGGYQIYHIKTQ